MIQKFLHFANPKVEIDLYTVYKDFLISHVEGDLTTVILKGVSEFYNIPASIIESKTKKREVVMARYNFYKLSKTHTKNSLKSIGLHCGGRDHSTVIHAIQTVNDIMETDTSFRNAVNELKKKFKMRSY